MLKLCRGFDSRSARISSETHQVHSRNDWLSPILTFLITFVTIRLEEFASPLLNIFFFLITNKPKPNLYLIIFYCVFRWDSTQAIEFLASSTTHLGNGARIMRVQNVRISSGKSGSLKGIIYLQYMKITLSYQACWEARERRELKVRHISAKNN